MRKSLRNQEKRSSGYNAGRNATKNETIITSTGMAQMVLEATTGQQLKYMMNLFNYALNGHLLLKLHQVLLDNEIQNCSKTMS
ncbi:hypothetical protein Tco_0114862 [Tanacetum coccineum]